MKKVLFIVVTYNGMQWLARCLGSIPSWADIYVWDNASTDGSADFVADNYPPAVLVRNAVNDGFAKPNNEGFRYAVEHGYDYVYLLNQDAWLEEGALEKLLAAAEAHPEYGLLSPMQYSDGFQAIDAQFLKDKTPPAAHWLVPVSSLSRIGLFDEVLFPFWGQDDDWCNRLRHAGLGIGIVEEARAVHDRALRTEPLERTVRRNYYTGSLVRLADVNRPLWESFLYVVAFTFVKAVKYRSFLPFKYFCQILSCLPRIREHRRAI